MGLIKILTNDFYNNPKQYRFMPQNFFDTLEKSIIGSKVVSKDIVSEVDEDEYLILLNDMTKYQNNLTDGNENN